MSARPEPVAHCTPRAGRLDLVTRGLPLWVALAMGAGLLLGRLAPTASARLGLGIPLGLFLMIFPAMTKLRLEDVARATRNRAATLLTLGFNYLLNPFLLWFFGWLFLRDAPDLWTGLILLGVAPCIAMVLVWTDLARGNNALAVTLMAWNSLIQIVTTPFFIWLIVGTRVSIDTALIAQSVLLYLGLPLAFGFALRKLMVARKGAPWFEGVLQPRLDRLQLGALLATLAVIYAMQGNVVLAHPGFIPLLAAPLALFFVSLFVIVLFSARALGQSYADGAAIAYNATGRNFELAIAIAVTAFGARPLVGASTAVGPLIEVPLMLGLVAYSKAMARRISWTSH